MNKTMLGIASVVASTSIAHAQPSLVASAPDTKPQTMYVQGGVAAGGDDVVGLYGAYTIEGGYRLNDTPLWVHGMLLVGQGGGVDETTYSSYMMQARLGVEARGCVVSAACAVFGMDAGFRHEMLMAEYDNKRADDAIVIPRVGLDIGVYHFRFRPGLEMGFGQQGFASLGATMAVAYQW